MKGRATVRLGNGLVAEAEVHWFEAHGIGRKRFYQEAVGMSDFVICIDNRGHPASLILGKAYRTLEDAGAEDHGLLRVVDEDTSEPDGYLYAASLFAPVELPEIAKRALAAADTSYNRRTRTPDGMRCGVAITPSK